MNKRPSKSKLKIAHDMITYVQSAKSEEEFKIRVRRYDMLIQNTLMNELIRVRKKKGYDFTVLEERDFLDVSYLRSRMRRYERSYQRLFELR